MLGDVGHNDNDFRNGFLIKYRIMYNINILKSNVMDFDLFIL